MAPSNKPVSISDVAQAAGVSVSTVSRVLNNREDVALDTRQKVTDVIRQLGYASSLAARSMRSRRKNLVGLVLPDLGDSYSIEIMKGVNQAVTHSEYDLLVYTTGGAGRRNSQDRDQHTISLLNKSITDGVLIVASAAAEVVTDAPVVAVDPHIANPAYPSVAAQNYEGALEAMQYLLSLGHERIGFVGGDPEMDSVHSRLQAYRDALAHAGEPDPQLIIEGDFTACTAAERAAVLLSLPDPPSAVFACNDVAAFGVFRAAEAAGLRIPEDLSVLGFDNIPEAAYRGLTTVDQSLAGMGSMAARMLIRLINGEQLEEQHVRMQTRLVIRESCRKVQLQER